MSPELDWSSRSSRWLQLPPVSERTASAPLRAAVAACPDRVAVVDPHMRFTYRELDDAAARLAGALAQAGVGRGTHVLTVQDNHAPAAVVWFALSYLGAVSVPVNTAYVGSGLRHVMTDSACSVALVDNRYLGRVRDANGADGPIGIVFGCDPDGSGGATADTDIATLWQTADRAGPVTLQPWDVHSIMYTSGTTSAPKGVVVPHALTYTRAAIYQEVEFLDTLRHYVALPFFHVVGQCRGILGPVIMRGTTCIPPRFSASRFWSDCRRWEVNDTCLLGGAGGFLVAQPPRPDDRDHPLARMHGVIPDPVGFRERFGVEVETGYGMTEIGTVTQGPSRPRSCGYVHHEYEWQLVDDHDVPVPQGGIGELVIRSTQPWTLATGYLNHAGQTVDTWRNLWFHTGDLMTSEPDDELLFVGRKKAIIRRRGENIAPAMVEDELLTHPAVAECAVVGVPDDDTGDEEVLAVIVLHAGVALDPVEVLTHLSGRVPYFAVPRYIQVAAEIPKTPTHKVDLGTLQKQVSSMQPWDREQHGVVVHRHGTSLRD